MRSLKKIFTPEVLLRLGLGLTFLYSGYNIFRYPENWAGFIERTPAWVQGFIDSYFGVDLFLQIQGVAEMAFAVVLLLWFIPKKYTKFVVTLIAIELALILWLLGIDNVSFRDVGLLGAALALLSSLSKRSYSY